MKTMQDEIDKIPDLMQEYARRHELENLNLVCYRGGSGLIVDPRTEQSVLEYSSVRDLIEKLKN